MRFLETLKAALFQDYFIFGFLVTDLCLEISLSIVLKQSVSSLHGTLFLTPGWKGLTTGKCLVLEYLFFLDQQLKSTCAVKMRVIIDVAIDIGDATTCRVFERGTLNSAVQRI